MKFLTVRDLSKSPKNTLSRLPKGGKAVLTNNGKPQALIIKIDGAGQSAFRVESV
jgi:hypothetical protein